MADFTIAKGTGVFFAAPWQNYQFRVIVYTLSPFRILAKIRIRICIFNSLTAEHFRPKRCCNFLLGLIEDRREMLIRSRCN